jgi:hypothetical protein
MPYNSEYVCNFFSSLISHAICEHAILFNMLNSPLCGQDEVWSLRITGEGLLISGTIPIILSTILQPHIYRVDTNTPGLTNKYYGNVLSPNTSAFGLAVLSPLSLQRSVLFQTCIHHFCFFLIRTHSSAVEAPML